MRTFITALSVFSLLFLFACQKEADLSNGNSGGNGGGVTNGTRLTKMVTKSGLDSSVENISYNSSGKIVEYKLAGVASGQPFDARLIYIRNNSGIIQKQILKDIDLAANGIDSIVTVVNYDAANNRYKSAVSVFSLFGFEIRDSVVFQYDGSGKLLSEIDYNDLSFGYMLSWKKEYSYARNNLAGEKFYSYNAINSTFDLEETYTYQYDSKINPLQFTSDAAVLNMDPFYSSNNVTKTTLVAVDPADNYVSTATYTYNSSNRPATSTDVAGTETSTTTYSYQ